MNDLIKSINLRFQSGNEIPVERAHITAKEWAELSAALMAMQQIVQVLGPKAPSCSGCNWEWAEALRIAGLAGFAYKRRVASAQ